MLGYSFKRGQITRLCLRAGARLKYSSVGWRGKGQNKCYGITMDNVHSLTYTSRPLKKTTTTQPTPLPPRSDTTLPPISVAPLSTLHARFFSLFFLPCPDSSLSFLRSSSFVVVVVVIVVVVVVVVVVYLRSFDFLHSVATRRVHTAACAYSLIHGFTRIRVQPLVSIYRQRRRSPPDKERKGAEKKQNRERKEKETRECRQKEEEDVEKQRKSNSYGTARTRGGGAEEGG